MLTLMVSLDALKEVMLVCAQNAQLELEPQSVVHVKATHGVMELSHAQELSTAQQVHTLKSNAPHVKLVMD